MTPSKRASPVIVSVAASRVTLNWVNLDAAAAVIVIAAVGELICTVRAADTLLSVTVVIAGYAVLIASPSAKDTQR